MFERIHASDYHMDSNYNGWCKGRYRRSFHHNGKIACNISIFYLATFSCSYIGLHVDETQVYEGSTTNLVLEFEPICRL